MKPAQRILPVVGLLSVMLAGTGPGVVAGAEPARETGVVVFAASSTTNAIMDIATMYEAQGRGHLEASFASSSTLAQQIARGAPADVYLSASEQWMDLLERKGAIEAASRFDLLGNRLALIVPSQSSIRAVDVRKGLDLAALLGDDGRLSIGDPAYVPAGTYGKKALQTLGLWDQVKDRLAPMKDVRAALVLVERGEVPLGLVYATDAAISRNVRVVGMFPIDSHPPIVYPVAAVTGGNRDAAASFLEFLRTPEARAVFSKYGFDVR